MSLRLSRPCLLPCLSENCPHSAELSIMPTKTTVVRKAWLYWLRPHAQCRAGDRMLRIITSIESAIQHSPVRKLHREQNI